MVSRAVTVSALALLAAAAPPAVAAEPPGAGERCAYAVTSRPDSARSAGYVRGGPVVIATATAPRAGRLVCSIQRNADSHDAPDILSLSSVTTYGAVALPPAAIELDTAEVDFLVLCTHVEIDGEGTYYWDEVEDAWSTDPSVPCIAATTGPPPPGPLLDTVNALVADHVDPAVCPVLASAAPGVPPVTIDATGDVRVAGELWWDCPPYVTGAR